eukprot:scaffold271522_cov31-Prasinocladus_malaysianus.AAC.1
MANKQLCLSVGNKAKVPGNDNIKQHSMSIEYAAGSQLASQQGRPAALIVAPNCSNIKAYTYLLLHI